MHYISFALHLFAFHSKIMPRQHEMHDTSRFKCHALLLLFHEIQNVMQNPFFNPFLSTYYDDVTNHDIAVDNKSSLYCLVHRFFAKGFRSNHRSESE